MKRIFLIIFSLSFVTAFAQQKKEEPTKWQIKTSKPEVQKGGTIDLIFTADIIDGWYFYSSDFDKELVPTVATFAFTPDAGYELVGGIKPVGAKSKNDTEIWMGTYTYFTKKAEFRQTVKILNDAPVIKVKLNGQACSDESGKCIPVIQQWTFPALKVTAAPAKPVTAPSGKNTEDNKKDQAKPDPKKYSSQLEYLKAEKAMLVKPSAENDEVIAQLKEFVKKYGN